MTPAQIAFEGFVKSALNHTSQEAYLAGYDAGFRAGRNEVDAAREHPERLPLHAAEEIYKAYPRHVGKGAAVRAIINAMRPGTSRADYLLDRTKAYAAAVARWPAFDRQFIPHPATWFNRESYDDDPKEWQRGTPMAVIRTSE